MTGTDDRWTIPATEHPSPVCAVRFDDGTAVVQRVNDRFESAFGSVDSGTSLEAVFDPLDVSVRNGDTLTAALTSADPVTLTVGERGGAETRYRVRAVDSTAEPGRSLVFTELPETTEDGQFGVDNVASVVSHELRNPLDVAKTRLRAGRELNEDRHFEHVKRAHDRMEQIIQDVLTLTRGSDVVDPDEPVALEAVAQSAWETVETNGTTLTVDGPLPTTLADADRTGRLFENLYRNSVEHGPDEDPDAGTEPIAVTVGPLGEAGTDGFFVEDTGNGVSPEERDRVFDPGYSSDEHGTGLGLAIVERIATLHGWSCEMTTADSGGARVEVSGVEPVNGHSNYSNN